MYYQNQCIYIAYFPELSNSTMSTVNPAHVNPAHVNPAHVNPAHVNPAHVNPAHVNPAQSARQDGGDNFINDRERVAARLFEIMLELGVEFEIVDNPKDDGRIMFALTIGERRGTICINGATIELHVGSRVAPALCFDSLATLRSGIRLTVDAIRTGMDAQVVPAVQQVAIPPAPLVQSSTVQQTENQQLTNAPVVEHALMIASKPLPAMSEREVPDLLRIGATTEQLQKILDSNDSHIQELHAGERALMRAIITKAMVDHERVLLSNNTAMVTLGSNMAEINRIIADLQQRKQAVQRSIDEINAVQQNVAAQIEKMRDRVEYLDALQSSK
jgi:hypothetical protein